MSAPALNAIVGGVGEAHRPRSFARPPALRALLGNDGVVGLTYAYIDLPSLPRAEAQGFRREESVLCFQIAGVWAVLCSQGKPVPGGRSTAQVIEPLVSSALRTACAPVAERPAKSK